jgi:hypothetical protein
VGQSGGIASSSLSTAKGERLGQALTQTTTTPTAAQREGMFTTMITGPTTGEPFSNYTIPASRITAPISAQILSKYYPVPLIPGATANNYSSLFNSNRKRRPVHGSRRFEVNDTDTICGLVSHGIVTRFSPGALDQFGSGTDIHPTNVTRVLAPRVIAAKVSWRLDKVRVYHAPILTGNPTFA